jgi:hypothetical protein
MFLCSIVANADLFADKYVLKEVKDTRNTLWHFHWSWHVWLMGLIILAILTVWEASERHVRFFAGQSAGPPPHMIQDGKPQSVMNIIPGRCCQLQDGARSKYTHSMTRASSLSREAYWHASDAR